MIPARSRYNRECLTNYSRFVCLCAVLVLQARQCSAAAPTDQVNERTAHLLAMVLLPLPRALLILLPKYYNFKSPFSLCLLLFLCCAVYHWSIGVQFRLQEDPKLLRVVQTPFDSIAHVAFAPAAVASSSSSSENKSSKSSAAANSLSSVSLAGDELKLDGDCFAVASSSDLAFFALQGSNEVSFSRLFQVWCLLLCSLRLGFAGWPIRIPNSSFAIASCTVRSNDLLMFSCSLPLFQPIATIEHAHKGSIRALSFVSNNDNQAS